MAHRRTKSHYKFPTAIQWHRFITSLSHTYHSSGRNQTTFSVTHRYTSPSIITPRTNTVPTDYSPTTWKSLILDEVHDLPAAALQTIDVEYIKTTVAHLAVNDAGHRIFAEFAGFHKEMYEQTEIAGSTAGKESWTKSFLWSHTRYSCHVKSLVFLVFLLTFLVSVSFF